MPGQPPDAFSYAILRAIPCIERGESINVGVVLHCRRRSFLALRSSIDPERLTAIAPSVSVQAIGDQLDAITRVADGDAEAGPIAELPQSERFGWIVAPSSTIVQASAVHNGLTDDPAATLDALHERLVAAPTG